MTPKYVKRKVPQYPFATGQVFVIQNGWDEIDLRLFPAAKGKRRQTRSCVLRRIRDEHALVTHSPLVIDLA
jgi:hypothetical protein